MTAEEFAELVRLMINRHVKLESKTRDDRWWAAIKTIGSLQNDEIRLEVDSRDMIHVDLRQAGRRLRVFTIDPGLTADPRHRRENYLYRDEMSDAAPLLQKLVLLDLLAGA